MSPVRTPSFTGSFTVTGRLADCSWRYRSAFFCPASRISLESTIRYRNPLTPIPQPYSSRCVAFPYLCSPLRPTHHRGRERRCPETTNFSSPEPALAHWRLHAEDSTAILADSLNGRRRAGNGVVEARDSDTKAEGTPASVKLASTRVSMRLTDRHSRGTVLLIARCGPRSLPLRSAPVPFRSVVETIGRHPFNGSIRVCRRGAHPLCGLLAMGYSRRRR